MIHHFRSAFILFLSYLFHIFHLFSLHFHYAKCLFQKVRENHNSILVCVHHRSFLFFFNLETFSIFRQKLHGCLLWQFFKRFVNFSFTTGENFELLRLLNILVLCYVFHKSFKKNSSFLNKILVFFSNHFLFRNAWYITTRPSCL